MPTIFHPLAEEGRGVPDNSNLDFVDPTSASRTGMFNQDTRTPIVPPRI
jgi:hypothetical protein